MTARFSTDFVQKVDKYVGHRLSVRRIALGMTQRQIADVIGITYQQVHKYEAGVDRISAGRLFQLARVLDVPVEFFFEGADLTDAPPKLPGQRAAMEVAIFFQRPSDAERAAVSHLVRTMASSGHKTAA